MSLTLSTTAEAQTLKIDEDPFDNEGFVERFNSRRCEHDSVNSCIDEPAILSRVRSLKPNSILELGCATGMLTKQLAPLASNIVAVDRSGIMIDKAANAVISESVSFVCSDFVEYQPETTFDLVVAGMTMHLIEDLPRVVDLMFGVLRDGGRLLFSQRHPARTCNPTGASASGEEPHWAISNYFRSGVREYEWLGTPVRCFHRSIEEIVSTVIGSGFSIVEIVEPQPESLVKSERIQENFSSPSVLLIHAVKNQ